MDKNVFGTAIVLYTFSKKGDDKRYNLKVDALKKLLPNNLYELEDQSSILIQSKCDIENLQKAIKDIFAEQLEETESIILISIDEGCLKCVSIQHTSLEKETEAIVKDFYDEKDVSKLPELAENLVNKLRENTKNVLCQIVQQRKL